MNSQFREPIETYDIKLEHLTFYEVHVYSQQASKVNDIPKHILNDIKNKKLSYYVNFLNRDSSFDKEDDCCFYLDFVVQIDLKKQINSEKLLTLLYDGCCIIVFKENYNNNFLKKLNSKDKFSEIENYVKQGIYNILMEPEYLNFCEINDKIYF